MEYSILEIQHLELKQIKEFQVFLLQYKYKWWYLKKYGPFLNIHSIYVCIMSIQEPNIFWGK